MRPAALALAALLLAAAGEAPPGGILSWCGGGVTGGGGGLRIAPDGSVTQLRRDRAGAPLVETPAPERRADYARLAAMLDAAGFTRLPRGTPSNMTCSLAWRDGPRNHEVLWPIGQPPAALGPILRDIEALR
ncbi:hypothetical protein J5Y09_18965 [Roseomonas sp. PWR1]|uniref:Uncharacterized protein n=1 Tax=Roseomonas nitratireducens TaxID=2820810 RepID=A0ABS4AXA0_9PROT|nr:hypothetical protein [Neoroseomonas nitratireducens]MBP0466015.1 hypothetical protein [Neoroseomonas nitratireducens]